MIGKILAGAVVVLALVTGIAIYYLQVYAYYDPITADQAALVVTRDGAADPLEVRDFDGIDANSSPLRFRACFAVDPAVFADAEPYPDPQPLNAPHWFSCFNAEAIGEALASGEARAFLSEREIGDGVDRVIAVYPDGRAFAWHQLNDTYRD